MRSLKKIIVISLTSIVFLSTSMMAHAETNQETLEKKEALIQEKKAEKQEVSKELEAVHNDLADLKNETEKNKENISALENEIKETQNLIDKKKKEIVVLEDKVLARKEVMKERLVTLQHNDQTNVFLEVLLNAEDLSDFLDRATAVSVIFNTDRDILEQQQKDLETIETEKQAIAEQEEVLKNQYETLAVNQAELEKNLQKGQQTLAGVQSKYNDISKEITLAENEKSAIQDQIKQEQINLKKQEKSAEARKQKLAKAKESAEEAVSATTKVAAVSTKKESSKSNNTSTNNSSTANSSKQSNKSSEETMYVTATAYSHESTKSDFTALGYNIKKNNNMKLIAVDPSVIPLGTRVWVEGYGQAIAGDTGGAIKGHKIDVLMPNNSKSIAWGRKTVKVIILK
ncbi:3D domain-containing protein [Niallia sp. NCCP-28]|uniref:3D domain-containing protein n=1 Tax=Niallia sp. NCCP-28 TaxID=2934712 RepID=UPI0020839C08|nr:3D domain-containing protein [Niallia sp. NCCP-28]GKU83254.1 cell wall-binding protein [Niallia sp. NCCP-28]